MPDQTPKTIDQAPTITDVIRFELVTTDINGIPTTPYKVNKAIIYFLARDFTRPKEYELTNNVVGNVTVDTFFSKAQVVKVFGDPDYYPAWLSSDVSTAYMTRGDGEGKFELIWTPEFAREGDYIICWTWTQYPAGDTMSSFESFFLRGDPSAGMSIPTHYTNPEKYSTLLARYLPEHATIPLGGGDLTPDVLTRLNAAVADGFTFLENLANQMVDLLDANSIHEDLLLYLANNFNLILRSDDPTLWRRQIKNAIPLYKKKGTLPGLTEALSQAGIKFLSWTQLWQVASPWTWQECFLVTTTGQIAFQLSYAPYLAGGITSLGRCPVGGTSFTMVASGSISATANLSGPDSDANYSLNWTGATLAVGDRLLVTYCRTAIGNSGTETYIRSLDLADQRDFTTVTYPPNNWNVHVIEETDLMFDTICPTKNPFAEPVIFGQVRTEFPYSENIYNMDEYNGSLRDSYDPCDISKKFIDDCTCCISSKFNIDIEIENISSGRIDEAASIIQEYKPFHSVVHQMNYQGSVNEFIPPQQEEVEMYIQMDIDDTFAVGNDRFYRLMRGPNSDPAEITRNALASITNTIQTSAPMSNEAVSMYCPDVHFDKMYIADDNLLEILSGVNGPSSASGGEYSVTNPQDMCVDFVPRPTLTFNQDAFPFRLSNQLSSGSLNSVTAVYSYIFSDPNYHFRDQGVLSPTADALWQIKVGPNSYIVTNTFPDGPLLLSSWTSNSSSSGVSYQLTKTDTATSTTTTVYSGTTGVMTVTQKGLVEFNGTDVVIQSQIQVGDWLYIPAASESPYVGQYCITGISGTNHVYVSGWSYGTVGSISSAQTYRRIVDNAVGYMGVRGLVINTSPVNYETQLAIQNGVNNVVPTWVGESDLEGGMDEMVEMTSLSSNAVVGTFKENFLILIGFTYYTISKIDGYNIYLNGPAIQLGVSGEVIPFTILQFTKTSNQIIGHNISFVDRRNGDMFEHTTEQQTSMSLLGSLLNKTNRKQALEYQVQSEGVTIEVEWKD